MSDKVSQLIDVNPPMANGEIVFAEPWQSRLFGIVEALIERGYFTRDTFRGYLIAEIDRWESEHSQLPRVAYSYFDLFQLAIVRLLEEQNILNTQNLEAQVLELKHRPHGHDHHH